MGLFKHGHFQLHSGAVSNFLIDCSVLDNEDWETLAYIVKQRFQFGAVIGIPRGGLPLAGALQKWVTPMETGGVNLPTLLVDDVLTSGKSMAEMKNKLAGRIQGVVVFDRSGGRCPDWIAPLFPIGKEWLP